MQSQCPTLNVEQSLMAVTKGAGPDLASTNGRGGGGIFGATKVCAVVMTFLNCQDLDSKRLMVIVSLPGPAPNCSRQETPS